MGLRAWEFHTMHEKKQTLRPGYVRREQAAEYLGVSVRCLANWQKKRYIPFSKIGSRISLFKLSDLDSVVARFRQDSIVGEG